MSVHDYETADELLKSNTRFKRRKVANNTWIQRSETYDNVIYLILHKSPILTYYKEGAVGFNTCGWPSPTTIDRMNNFQNRIHLFRNKNKWWWCKNMDFKNHCPFKDRMIVYKDGQIAEDQFESQVEHENFGHLMGRY